ncbi:AI-2E family transporter [Enterovibrio makurazakiensis]|uniref:AI-2E family transporter n=1 Tax=Enterovibrio gelatinilyticus TaxID=2899819 RepID=A0ABT5R3U9_9GAMM|nr:AI-2E family transporter [Enterovibrio sp. ZSDZ42]MDD1794187.1 AI-2E family transporter [Enterovibrio sp. ZSDZ42]
MASSFKIEPRHWTLIGALALAAYACYVLIAPYIGSIVLAFIVSLLFFPLHDRIDHKLKSYPNLSAALSCTILTVMIIIPMIFVIGAILRQGITFFTGAYEWLSAGGAKDILSMPIVQTSLQSVDKWLPFDSIDPQDIISRVASTVSTLSSEMIGMSSQILGDVTGMFVNFLLMLFVLFFLLRDHDKIIQLLRHVSPLSRSQEDTLLDEVEKVAKSAVMGSFLTALAQGLVGGFAMWMAGFAGLFWGTMMGFASFIPVVGTALIWLPAAGYLLIIGQWEWAAFLVGWGVIVVGSVDNILRPLLMQGNSGMNTLLIFFSLIGGLQVYGLMGLVYGPIIFSLTLVLFRMYEAEFHNFLEKQDNS